MGETSDFSFSIETLLEDLDEAMGDSVKKFVPHPPTAEKSPTQTLLVNPKLKFAVLPHDSMGTENSTSSSSMNNNSRRYDNNAKEDNQPSDFILPFSAPTSPAESKNPKNEIENNNLSLNTETLYNSNGNANNNENGLDSLLKMLNSPSNGFSGNAPSPDSKSLYGLSPLQQLQQHKSSPFSNPFISNTESPGFAPYGANPFDSFGFAASSSSASSHANLTTNIFNSPNNNFTQFPIEKNSQNNLNHLFHTKNDNNHNTGVTIVDDFDSSSGGGSNLSTPRDISLPISPTNTNSNLLHSQSLPQTSFPQSLSQTHSSPPINHNSNSNVASNHNNQNSSRRPSAGSLNLNNTNSTLFPPATSNLNTNSASANNHNHNHNHNTSHLESLNKDMSGIKQQGEKDFQSIPISGFSSTAAPKNSTVNSFSSQTQESSEIPNIEKVYTNINTSLNKPSARSRCSRVALAGSSSVRGTRVSAFSKCACDSMRCMKCNFAVVCYKDCKWDSSADYMFFRNNTPNDAKLSKKLLSMNESCAYCCQCTWIDLTEERILVQANANDPQWICAGHS